MKKFELTTNTKIKFGRKLFQIRAIISFDDVEKGDLGGWVESEHSIADNVWLYSGVDAFKGAVLRGGVLRGGEFWGGVFHSGQFWGGEFWGGVFRGGVFRGGVFHSGVFHSGEFWGGEFWGGEFHSGEFWGDKKDWYFVAGPQGSRQGFATAVATKAKGLRWNICATRYDITSDELRAAVIKNHGDSDYAQDYLALIAFVENHPGLKRKLKDWENDNA